MNSNILKPSNFENQAFASSIKQDLAFMLKEKNNELQETKQQLKEALLKLQGVMHENKQLRE